MSAIKINEYRAETSCLLRTGGCNQDCVNTIGSSFVNVYIEAGYVLVNGTECVGI